MVEWYERGYEKICSLLGDAVMSWVRAPAMTLLRNTLGKLLTRHCLIHVILHEEDCELLIKSDKKNRGCAVSDKMEKKD